MSESHFTRQFYKIKLLQFFFLTT